MAYRSKKYKIDEELKENTDESLAEVETNGPETKNGKIINSLFVKARKKPSFESDVLEILRKGDPVKIIDRVGDFYKVSTILNELAYVSSEFVMEE